MYEKIMVPLDGSSTAEMALPYAEQVSAKFGAETLLVSVVEPAGTEKDSLYEHYLKKITEETKERFERLEHKEETKIQSKILPGKPAHEILKFADENNVNLIVMASRGHSGSGPWLLGNIAAKVLRATSKPVMLIKKGSNRRDLEQRKLFRKILVPLDGSKEGEQAIPQAEALAKAFGAEMILLQVYDLLKPIVAGEPYMAMSAVVLQEEEEQREASAMDYLMKTEEALRRKGLDTSKVVLMGSAADKILDYAEANGIDLIAMSTHGRSGIGRWVFGSVTDKVLHAGDTPVLAVRVIEKKQGVLS
jgi:nucleotide-binding universal stress UspA family protein